MIQQLLRKLKQLIKTMTNMFMVFKNFYDYWKDVFNTTDDQMRQYEDSLDTPITQQEIEDYYFEPVMNTKLETNKEINETINQMRQNTIIYQVVNKTECIITIPNNKTIINDVQSTKIAENNHYEIVISHPYIGCIGKVKLLGKTYKITCNHVVDMLDLSEMSGFNNINQQIMINSDVRKMQQFSYLVNERNQVQWYTKDLIDNTFIYAVIDKFKAINLYTTYKGRPKIATVAIVVSIQIKENLLYSGTIMTVEDHPFIVTFQKHITQTNVTHIVALACFPHKYLIKISDET